MDENIPFHYYKQFRHKVFLSLTAGDNVVKESRPLPVGVGIQLYTCSCGLNLFFGIEIATFQLIHVLFNIGGDEQHVPRLKVALLQAEYTL